MPDHHPTHLLVLGGTKFLGRAVVAEALAAGHRVTMFNRGITNPQLFPDAETVRGDRTADLFALAGRTWDAVIDVAAYRADVVRRSVDALVDAVDRYVFVSTLSVYRDHRTTAGQHEGAAVLDLDDATDPGLRYGANKAAGERIVTEAFGPRATVARAGLIAGPHDPTGRFVYWPRRMATGGRVLAPGAPGDPLQCFDVRDLAGWLVHAAVTGVPGTFNVAGRSTSFGALLEACQPNETAVEVVWVPSDQLLAAGLDPWMGVPLWIAAPGWEAANAVDITRATAAGLSHRPIGQTIRGALAHPGDDGPPTFTAEAELLARFG